MAQDSVQGVASAGGAARASWRVPAIDGVRALAMLMVYCYHSWQFAGSPSMVVGLGGLRLDLLGAIAQFPAGVDLFMVLSGFCLFLPLCKPNAAGASGAAGSIGALDVRKYFTRRLRRIVPPYYAAIVYATLLPIVLVILFRALGQEAKWQPIPSAWQYVTHLLFIHTFFTQTWDGINGVFWSLGLEAQFYAVFPLAVLGFRRFGPRFLLAMVAASVVYRVAAGLALRGASSETQFLFSIFFLGRWMQFALGMGAAWLVARRWNSGRLALASDGNTLLAFALALYVAGTSGFAARSQIFPLRDLLLAIAFAAGIVALCASPTPAKRLFEGRAAVGLGFISYSVFLLHQPTAYYISQLIEKKAHLSGLPGLAFLCSVGLATVLAISYAFFLAFERPFLSAPRPRQLRATTATATALSTSAVQDQALP